MIEYLIVECYGPHEMLVFHTRPFGRIIGHIIGVDSNPQSDEPKTDVSL